VARSAYYALYALQHRGQESCGIAVGDEGNIRSYADLGLVPDVFGEKNLTSLGAGRMAVGHTRYSTTGGVSRINCQPMVVRKVDGSMAVAHNGNIINAFALRNRLEHRGAIFHTTSDTEVISYVITGMRLRTDSTEKAVEAAMRHIRGAYSLVLMDSDRLIGVRDPQGFRPLCMGETPDGSVVFASESCALDCLGARMLRDLEPGEIVCVSDKGIESIRTHCGEKSNICVFEFVYFSRPDSVIEGASVHESRRRAGELLYEEHPVEADVVIGVPDSGLDAALGFSMRSGIPYGVGFIKNRYVGRTFIQPSQGQREDAVRIKLNALSSTVAGKRVVMVDDSIVRGTTSAQIVNLLRKAGATQVHMRVSSPPFRHPCFFGTDVDSREKLIANQMSIEEIARKIHVDSLGYLSLEGVRRIANTRDRQFCSGCFNGVYPIDVGEESSKGQFESDTAAKGREKG
jgi:amidophosphoribosyltransferase